MPTKSVSAERAGSRSASVHSGEPVPKTLRDVAGRRGRGVLELDVRRADTPPTSQPARVNGTHGAGVVFCAVA